MVNDPVGGRVGVFGGGEGLGGGVGVLEGQEEVLLSTTLEGRQKVEQLVDQLKGAWRKIEV